MLTISRHSVWAVLLLIAAYSTASAGEPKAQAGKDSDAHRAKRVLLLGQGPDGHPWATHEYQAGLRILAQCLHDVPHLQTILVSADEPWSEGPELIDGANGVVLFLSQGAHWIHQDPARLAAFQRLAARGGGFVCLHWGMGCKDARYIKEYVNLFGGCHGGPDRKYRVVEVATEIAGPTHPIMQGLIPFDVREEFYYALKFKQPAGTVTPLLNVSIEGEMHTVAWAWERPDGGRSFGFSGGHFHENWGLEEYRRMLTQAVLWTLDVPVPEDGLSLEFSQQDLQQPRPKP